MTVAIYRIADLGVDMNPTYPLLQKQAAPYRVEDTAVDVRLYLSEADLDEKDRLHPHLTREECEYFFLGAQFYTYLLDHSGCLLHASAVALDGKAYLFSAPCGTGKSTHTGLWRQYFGEDAEILNDDKPAIRLIDDTLWVYGTPFSGKVDLSANKRAPLAGICMLEQGSENRIRRLTPAEALPLLMQQTIRPTASVRMEHLLTRLDEILRTVPVYRMSCTISEEAVQTSYEAMSGNPYADRVKQ